MNSTSYIGGDRLAPRHPIERASTAQEEPKQDRCAAPDDHEHRDAHQERAVFTISLSFACGIASGRLG